MRTLDRYVIRETVVPFFLALTVLTFLFAVQPMMAQAQDLLTKGAPVGTVVYLLINLLPQALGVTLPMAFLIGLLMALGRLSADRETVAFLACGVSLWRLLRPAIVMSVLVGGVTLYVMIESIPAGNRTFINIVTNLVAQKSAQEIKPGVFYEGFPGKVLFVETVRSDGIWENVMLATAREDGLPSVFLANEGQLVISREENRVEIILRDVSRRIPGADPGEYDRADHILEDSYYVDPLSVFPRIDIIPDINSMTIAELKADMVFDDAHGNSTHNAEIHIQQKFSFPVACLVMALLGVAVGVHTRKDGKLASFALGLGLIFIYYVLMIGFETLTKGGHFSAVWARWMPNLLLGPAALGIIWWRTHGTERSIAIRLPRVLAARLASPGDGAHARSATASKSRPVLVIRLPTLGVPRPRLIDLYVMRQYIHIVSLAFVALLGLFYVSTAVDLSDKLFKPHVSGLMLIQFLWYSTPQYIYFLVPIAILVAVLVTVGGLTKNSELTVLRACGVSLYRIAVPLLVLATVWSGVLFMLEEYVLAAANKHKTALENIIRERQTSVVDLTNRHWLVGTEGRVYYYGLYDAKGRTFVNLSVYDIERDPYRVSRHTFVQRAQASSSGWTGGPGWVQDFPEPGGTRHEKFTNRPLKLDPAKYFATEQTDAEAMTVKQLRTYVGQLKQSGLNVSSYEVDLQRKIAGPLMAVVMTLIALPFAVTTGKRGALYGIGLAIALAFTYQIAFTVFGVMGNAQLLPAALAAWAPNLLFLAGAAYGLLTVRT
jgi:LPS export ABC transporter permease LptG/LPS export ABC transporter permease LptF